VLFATNSFSVIQVIGLVVFTVLLIVWLRGVFQLPARWRISKEEAARSLRDDTTLMTQRKSGTPVLILAAGGIGFTIAIGTLFPGSDSPGVFIPEILFGLIALAFAVAFISIVLFGRPKALIPPNLREVPSPWSILHRNR
jgi:protein-S-isoprenylcysteine O-methyltransferase Ste14